MTTFSETTNESLRHSGWTEGRSVDTTQYEQYLKAEGYPVHDTVREFLRQFGGLTMTYPHAKVPNKQDDLHLIPKRAGEIVFPEKVTEYYSDRAGTPLCVIGTASRDYLVLMMDREGGVYAGFDEVFLRVGDSGADAIEALCSGRKLAELPE